MSHANSDAPLMGLSDALVYNRHKANSVPARKQLFAFTPWNSSTSGFTGSDTIKINVSGGDAQFLNTKMSYLQLKVNCTTAAAELDGSAYALIRSISVYQGTNLLERLDNYNNLYTTLYHLQGNVSNAGAGDALLFGTGAEIVSNATVVGAGAILSTGPTMAGRGVAVALSSATPNSTTFCLPLVGSAIFGPNQRMLPLCKLAELRIEIVLEDFASAFYTAGGGTDYKVTDARFMAEIVTLDGGVMGMIDEQIASTGGELKISTEGWSNFQSAHSSGNTVGNVLISARYSSVKTLISTFRQTANKVKTARWLTSRSKPDFKSWSYICGNVRYPYSEVMDDIQAYVEAQRGLHQLGTLESSGLCNRTNWIDAGAGTNMGSYALVQCLENQSHKSAQLAGCGINLTKQDCYLNYTLNTNATGYLIDVFVNYDIWMVIRDRLIYIQN